jgi:gliding motility-associated lipoprotein GldH
MKLYCKIVFPLIALVLSFSACQKVDVFEKNISLKDQHWPSSFKPEISFNISDTISSYNIFVVVRHNDTYRYNNLWLNIYTLSPGDSVTKPQALDLQLASNEQGWLGTGMDDIFEHRIKISQTPVSLKAGTYRFQLEQIMRDDPLESILNVGIRVERTLN